jgi:predicted acyltransferase
MQSSGQVAQPAADGELSLLWMPENTKYLCNVTEKAARHGQCGFAWRYTRSFPGCQDQCSMSSSHANLSDRVVSVDAFRGFTMFCMFAGPFGLRAFEDAAWATPVLYQLEHAAWTGVRFWDLVQPFFMFIVGVVMPWSFGRRWERGETWAESLRHVLKRAALLVGWGLVARSVQAQKPVLDLINVLAQIAFTYTVAFLLLRKSLRVQFGAALGILALHTGAYLLWAGGTDPWARDANFGQWLDQQLLGKNWGGSYATFNCVSSAFNTILGVLAGTLLFSTESPARKLRLLAASGAILLAAGLALHPLVPVIKKIWTASFALASGGLTLLALLFFYWICDVAGRQRWAVVFVAIGANSIFIYLFHEILGRWMRQTAPVFTSWSEPWVGQFHLFAAAWLAIGLQVYLCWWLYERRIYLKL